MSGNKHIEIPARNWISYLVYVFLSTPVCLLCQEPFICTGDFYLSQSMGITEGFSDLFSVKVDSGTQEIIFNPLPTTNEHPINAIGYRVTDNLVYGIDPVTQNFYQIDATGKSYLLRNLNELNPDDQYFGADIFPSGDFMVMIGGESVDKNLVIINLTNPNYPLEIIPLKMASTGGLPNTRIVDIAFDPLTRELFGMDVNNYRMVKIALGTGTIFDNIFPSANIDANIAALFFDTFGNLYGYGSAGGPENFAMYRINKVTGQLTFATVGPSTGGVDGCSCPFNISMEKTAVPDTAFLCADVLYKFKIANGSQSTHTGIVLEDELPESFEIISIEHNPFTTETTVGIGTNKLVLGGMRIPPGLDSVVIKVNVGQTPPGTYGNLAILKNLPLTLGSFRYSENPATLSIGNRDSTYLTLESPITSFEATEGICEGDTTILTLSVPNADYLWQDGSTDSFLIVTKPGMYSVTATNGCNTYSESVDIELQNIELKFVPEKLNVVLGNEIQLNPVIDNTGSEIFFSWQDPLGNSLNCINCDKPFSSPIADVVYLLDVENEYGCKASASVTVEVEINRELYIPNIFSPNNDNINDLFYIRGAGNFEIKFFHIYDRWGNLVFTGNDSIVNDPSSGWNGQLNGKILDAGVYTWRLLVRYLDNVEKNYTGSITLVK